MHFPLPAVLAALATLTLAGLGACTGDEPTQSTSSSSSSGGNDADATTSSSGAPSGSSSSSGTASSSSSSSGAADAGDADGGDAAPDDGSPASISGLAFWLEGDDLEPGLVTTWTDRSGKGNSATSSGTKRPTASSKPDGINGHVAVKFASTDLTIADAPSVRFDSTGFLLAVVERHPAYAAAFGDFPGVLFDKSSTGSPFPGVSISIGYDSAAAHPAYLGARLDNANFVETSRVAPGLAAGSHLVVMRLNAGVLSLAVDSATPLTSNVVVPSDLGQEGTDVFIGRSQSALGFPFTGDLAAVIGVRAPSDADAARVSTYLRNRFGL